MADRKESQERVTEQATADRKPDELVCFCFGYTMADIERDARRHGRSVIFERIAAAKNAGGCHCARKNPKGV